MENNYNLDDVNDSFEFTLSGNRYKMRYPTTEEVELGDKLKTDAEKLQWLYDFISPVELSSPPITEVLKRVNVKVLARFNEMIKTEFGG